VAEDRPAPVAGLDPPGGRDLPAPYQDPWTRLGRDLRAVAASERLRLWRLARRNRQGDLPVPGFWPRGLRPWFWPLLLSLILVAAGALIALALSAPPSQRPPAAAPVPPTGAPSPEVGMGENPSEETPEAPPEPSQPATGGPPTEPLPAEPLAAAEPETDPLLALLQPADPRRLIRAVQELPARGCLVLELADGFIAQPPAEAQRQAEAWRLLALEQGYERLELLDGAGRLLGRTARVGSGMILLTSAAPAPDAPRSPAATAPLG
jgi:hypothetical protein